MYVQQAVNKINDELHLLLNTQNLKCAGLRSITKDLINDPVTISQPKLVLYENVTLAKVKIIQ